ncbi:PTS sugar transporter subunit IIA [Ligilactobacillus equi]|uniref:PTS sugar transporter subunit IIA n=1 Tax=Ligilactobacillus equi TaxID=137357 RepID=UPI002ED44D65
MDTQEKTKMSMGQRLAYAFGAFGNDAFYGLLSGYLIMFITSHLFNSGDKALDNRMISLVTLIIMLLRIVELLIDPFIGNAIDRTKTRWGHFRPWVVIGGTISAVLLLLLFTTLGNLYAKNAVLYLVVFAFMYITMDIFYSFKDVGFWSMLPSLTTDSHEREKTATFARFGSTIGGGLVGVLVMPAVIFFSRTKTSSGDDRGWFMFALIICTIALLSAWAVGFFTREVNSEIRENKEDTVGVFQVLKAVGQNDQLLWIAIAYMFYGIGNNILGSLEVYYFTYIMDQPTSFSILSTINIFLGMGAAAIFPWLSKHFSRRAVFTGALTVMLIAIGCFSMAGSNLAFVLFSAVLFAFPQQIVFLVVLMIITDSVEYGQWKLGHRDESLSLSIRPLVDKFGGAVSNGVVGQIAIIAGMTTGATASSITAAGRVNFKIMMFAVPAVMMVIAIIIFWKKIILTNEKHAEIVAELEKTWGKDLTVDAADQEDADVKNLTLASPIEGKLLALDQVEDDIFASGDLGQGFAIKPTDGKVLAPFDATVRQVFTTRHAVGLVGDNGIVMLIHIGLGTVKLKGTGFVSYVEAGQKVKKGDELIEFWAPTILKAGLDDTVIVTVTNSQKFTNFKLDLTENTEVNALQEVFSLERKD